MQLIEFPDAEDAWQTYLEGLLDVPVGTKVKSVVKFVRLLRAGGNSSNKVLDSPQMIFECYARNDAEAAKFAKTVRALVYAAEGTEIAPGVRCKKLRDVSGPSNVSDKQHDSSRYAFTVMTDLRGTTRIL